MSELIHTPALESEHLIGYEMLFYFPLPASPERHGGGVFGSPCRVIYDKETLEMRDEGVIKFQCEWVQAEPPATQEIEEMNIWRAMLFQSGLIGVYPDGIGFGNISIRFGGTDQFWITGTQTGHLPELTREHYTRVTDYSIAENKVTCKGPIKASSESLTHAAIYEMDHCIHAIVHVHHAKLWDALKNNVPTTSSSVPYGTPQMALAVKSLYDHGGLAAQKIFVMAGHEDGLISFGSSLMEAASIMLGYWRQV